MALDSVISHVSVNTPTTNAPFQCVMSVYITCRAGGLTLTATSNNDA